MSLNQSLVAEREGQLCRGKDSCTQISYEGLSIIYSRVIDSRIEISQGREKITLNYFGRITLNSSRSQWQAYIKDYVAILVPDKYNFKDNIKEKYSYIYR